MPFDTSHGERLTEARQRLGVSQVELADTCGITRTMLSRYERAAAEPGSGSLIALANAGVDVLYVLTGRREGQSEATLNADEHDLLDAWRSGTQEVRAALQAVAKLASSYQEK